jgi:hypothetical protein
VQQHCAVVLDEAVADLRDLHPRTHAHICKGFASSKQLFFARAKFLEKMEESTKGHGVALLRTMSSNVNVLVTYFINKSHPLPRDIIVLPPRS